MSNLHRSLLKGNAPPMGMSSDTFRRHQSKRHQKPDYTPKQWNEFFHAKEDIEVDQNRTFRIYRSQKPEKSGPVLILLHGGGYSGLTWAQFSFEITQLVHCECIAIDLRGHGNSVTNNDEDLSTDTLCNDICDLIMKLFPQEVPPLYIVGHSMGGALAVHFAHKALVSNIVGLTVIDVVEGTAMEALSSMQRFLHSRPSFFKSMPTAIEWCVRSGQVRNVDSARVSVPGQIINSKTREPATNELPLKEEQQSSVNEEPPALNPFSIAESEEEEHIGDNPSAKTVEHKFQPPACVDKDKDEESHKEGYVWRIDLSKSEKYWVGWFSGLSERFLNLRMPKQLILASIEGLDKVLIVGQMQGRFQMQVLARCGHAVHEDRPMEVAETISSYMIRNRIVEAIGEVRTTLPAC